MTKTLAVDQSLSQTGYWISSDINGIIKTNKIKTNVERIVEIREKLKDLIHNNDINEIVIEGYSYGSRNTKFTFTAGEVGGMIKLLCYDLKLKLIVISPTQLKKYICGKGNAKKEQVLLSVYKKFNKEFKTSDECDAFCLHKFYEDYLEWKDRSKDIIDDLTSFTKREIECFKKLDENINYIKEDE